MRHWDGIIVHWSASGPYTTVSQITSWHKGRGWSDIGYHRVIVNPLLYAKKYQIEDLMPGDLIKLGRKLDNDLEAEWDERGAHTKGKNSSHIGVCVIGGPKSTIHPLQFEALHLTLEIFCKRYRISPGNVFGHQDFNDTLCPGPDLYKSIQSWKEEQKLA